MVCICMEYPVCRHNDSRNVSFFSKVFFPSSVKILWAVLPSQQRPHAHSARVSTTRVGRSGVQMTWTWYAVCMLRGSVESINPFRRYKWNSCEGKRMEKSDACDPYSRPARRTQWIVSTLAYHYGLDRGVENEIIVLATGLDQYLQEIFHHLDCQGDGKIPAEDFNILCEILGLSKESDLEECAGILDNLPKEFSFRQFHARLCGHFSTKAGCRYENGRLLVGKESEHIETQIRLRSPLRRRKKLLSLGTSSAKRESGEPTSPTVDRHASGCRQLGSCTRECYEEIVALEEAEDRIAKLEEENASLRELVEDMRAALQSSDARSLALQVQSLWSTLYEIYSNKNLQKSSNHILKMKCTWILDRIIGSFMAESAELGSDYM